MPGGGREGEGHATIKKERRTSESLLAFDADASDTAVERLLHTLQGASLLYHNPAARGVRN